MLRSLRVRASRGAIAALAALAAAAIGAAYGSAAPARPSTTVTVSTTTVGPPVPVGFVGMSMEYRGLEIYLGHNAHALDQAFVQLLRNLSPAGGAVVRIGGDSSDWSWWPVPGMTAPGGVKYSFGPIWSSVARALVSELHARLILGLNFEADSSKIAAYEAAQLLKYVGSNYIEAFELGNEPELYASFPWYSVGGRKVPGRAPGYDVQDYLADFAKIAGALPHAAPLAGPSSGSANWLSYLGTFASRESNLNLLTVHAYPTKHCGNVDITPDDLFQTASLQGLAGQIGGWDQVAAAHHLPLRVDEMNSVSCGGERGLSNSFAPALWAVEMLPQLVREGVTGVNFHTIPKSINAILNATQTSAGWRVSAQPEYMGLMAFAQAAPAGARLLKVSAPTVTGLDEWAARAANGAIHVVIVNSSSTAQTVGVSIAGARAGVGASVTRLLAPSLTATSGVTLDGQALSPVTGALSGNPVASTVSASNGSYDVFAPAASATIVTIDS